MSFSPRIAPRRTAERRSRRAARPVSATVFDAVFFAFCILSGFSPAVAVAQDATEAPGIAAPDSGSTASPAARTSRREAPPPPPAPSRPVTTKVELYDIQDRALLLDLWAYTGNPEKPEPGAWQVMLVTDSVQRGWMLREGTQAGELREEAIDWIRQEIREATREGRLSRTQSDGFWANFWNPDDPMAPYQWRTGLRMSTGFEAAAFRRTTLQNVRRTDFMFTQQPWQWVTVGAGFGFERHMGGLRRNLTNPLDTLAGWDAWDAWRTRWRFAVGVPGAMWELSKADNAIPEFYWLEPNAGEGTYLNGRNRAGIPVDSTEGVFAPGAVVRGWRDGGPARPPRGNLAHTFRLRAGQLRYNVTFDSDVYRAAVHQFLIDEIAAPFGQWSVGVTTSAGQSHTHLGLGMIPFRTGLGPDAAGRSVSGHLLHFALDYRDASTFRVSVSANARIDAPHFRPGGLFP